MLSTAPTLRPMNLGDILDTTFSLYRQNFALFAGIVAVLTIPETILNLIVTASASGGTITSFTPAGSGLSGLIGLAFGALITGALAQAISARYLGRQMTVGQAYASIGMSTFISLIAATILEVIVVGLGFVFVIIPGIFLIVKLLFVPQAIVLERTDVFGAFRRSWDLTRGSWWRVFGIGIVLFLIVAVIQAAVGGIAGIALTLGSGTGGREIGTVISAVVGILVRPIELGGLTLLYYDLRIRKEGFDLAQMASAMGSGWPG